MVVRIRVNLHLDAPAEIDLARLTRRARALAEAWAANYSHRRGPVVIESTRPIRKLDSAADPRWYPDLDAPHRTTWSSWSDYPPDSTMDPHDYIEQQAARLPIGYVAVSAGGAHRAPSADAALADGELITRAQVIEVLRDLGRPLSLCTLDNYRAKPPAGWPQPVRYVGRTPLWDRRAIETYAHHAPSWGAR